MEAETPKKHRVYLVPTDCCCFGEYVGLGFESTNIDYFIEDQNSNSIAVGNCMLFAIPFYLKKSLMENSISECELINHAPPKYGINSKTKIHTSYLLDGSISVISVNDRILNFPELRNLDKMLRLNLDEISSKVFGA
nr:hypothetical protein [Candidatus Woesearchaeota archaeon]